MYSKIKCCNCFVVLMWSAEGGGPSGEDLKVVFSLTRALSSPHVFAPGITVSWLCFKR